MDKIKFNFAAVFAIVVLIFYSYITFLGLDYWKHGQLLIPALITVASMALVIVCIYIMCRARATRWKNLGLVGQIIFGIVVLAFFIISTIPFTNFMGVVEKKAEIKRCFENTLNSTTEMDKAYMSYAENRLNTYRRNLEVVANGKNLNPTEYNDCLGNAAGSDDDNKISNLINSLRGSLLPEGIQDEQTTRQNWLRGANNSSVWNIMLPANIEEIKEAADGWCKNYVELSKVSYKGENSQPFEFSGFDNNFNELTGMYTTLHAPSVLSIIIAIICFLIMLVPYFMTQMDVAGKVEKNSEEDLFFHA